MRVRKLAWAAAALTAPLFAALALPAAAQGPTFQLTSAGYPANSSIISLSTNGGVSFTGVYAGRYTGSLNGGPSFNILCTDVNHDISIGDTYSADISHRITDAPDTNPTPGNGYSGGLASAILPAGDYGTGVTDLAAALFRADEVAWLADHYLNASLTTQESTALSLSVWDIVQDGGGGLGVGSVRSDYGDGGWVNTYETEAASAVTGGFHSSDTAHWIQAVSPNSQDYVYEVPAPEPSSVAAFAFTGLGTLGLILRARGTRRRADRCPPAQA